MCLVCPTTTTTTTTTTTSSTTTTTTTTTPTTTELTPSDSNEAGFFCRQGLTLPDGEKGEWDELTMECKPVNRPRPTTTEEYSTTTEEYVEKFEYYSGALTTSLAFGLALYGLL